MRSPGLAPIAVLCICLGCQDTITPPTVDSLAQQYRSLTLNHHAITLALLAPYNTLQLTATPRQASGAPLVASGTVVWTSSDTGVQVDSTGRLTAIAAVRKAIISVKMSIGGVRSVTLFDTALVNVNDVSPVPTFASIAFVPEPGDSTRFNQDGVDADGNLPRISFSALDPDGNPISNVRFLYTESDSNVVVAGGSSNEPFLTLGKIGHSWIYAEATVYGVTHSDSLLYTVTPQLHSLVNVDPLFPKGRSTPVGYFYPQDDTIAVGGSVVWTNNMPGQGIDVVFDSPPAPVAPSDSVYYFSQNGFILLTEGGGNIPAFAACDSLCKLGLDTLGHRGRSFPKAGTYPYHSALYHTTGVIHVVPNRE